MKIQVRSRTGGLLVLLGAILGEWPALPAAAELPQVRVGVVVDGPWSIDREAGRSAFARELTELMQGEFEVRVPKDRMLVADYTAAGVEEALDRLLADAEVDMVIAGGAIASHVAARRRGLPKPVIAVLVIDAQVQGIPLEGQASGVENLSYITFPLDVQRDLQVFGEVVEFERLAMLFSRAVGEAIPELRDYFVAQARETDVEVIPVPVEDTADAVLAALPEEVDAVFVALPLHLSDRELERLAEGLIDRRLPSFTAQTTRQVELGLLVGLHSDADVGRLARRAALNAQRILLGEKAGALPVVMSRQERLTINQKTARAIGVNPSWSVLTEAELINPVREEVTRQLTLVSAVQEALRANLDLAAKVRATAAGEREVRKARASLLPQVELNGTGTARDADMASAFQPERSIAGTGTVNQVIYSEAAWANLGIQRHLQQGRRVEREQLRLDIAQTAAVAYLYLLRARTFEQIQRENLELTRSNLELARLRQAIGMSGAAEVYRWESQIAAGRNAVIEANAQRNLAEIALNRVLHRPLEESFTVQETGLHDESLATHEPRFMKYMETPRNFKILRAFMVQDGLTSAPELERLDAAVAAQERGLSGARRALWAPTLGVQGSATNRIYDEGKGAAEAPEGTDWSVGVNVRVPLYGGGSRIATYRQAEEELEQLRLERQAAAERVEQRIRSALHLMGASFAGISLSQDAAVATARNLEMVKDAYGRGTIDILGLLDAQNAAVLAEAAAASAVYDFLIDLMEVERSIGKFYFWATQEQRDGWFNRLDAYFEEAVREEE